jgi:ketosteroid isomerase-like protein
MSEENVEIVRRTTDAMQAALERYDLRAEVDVEAMAVEFDAESVASPDLELVPDRHVPGVESYRGVKGLVEFMRTWTENFEDWSNEYERFIDAPNDRVVAIAHQSGRGQGSSVPVEMRYGMVFELEDRRVIRLRLFMDPAEALEAAGLSDQDAG